LTILEEDEDKVYFDGETFQFYDDSLLEKFDECLKSMDEAAEIERFHFETKKFSVATGLRKLFGFLK